LETGSVSAFRWEEGDTYSVGSFRKCQPQSLDCWVPDVEWLRLALSKGPNRVSVSLPSLENGGSSSFRNVVFSIYLEFRTMNTVQKPNDSEHSHCALPPLFILVCTAETTLTSFMSYAYIKKDWGAWDNGNAWIAPCHPRHGTTHLGGAATQNHPWVKSSCFISPVRAMRWTSDRLCPPGSKDNIGSIIIIIKKVSPSFEHVAIIVPPHLSMNITRNRKNWCVYESMQGWLYQWVRNSVLSTTNQPPGPYFVPPGNAVLIIFACNFEWFLRYLILITDESGHSIETVMNKSGNGYSNINL
jgi:hypothetical protein